MPQVADPNAQSNQMANGIQNLAQGIGDAIGGYREEQREAAEKARLQSNWQAEFDQAKDQWQKQFDEQQRMNNLSRVSQVFQMKKAMEQQEWLQKFYDQFFADDQEYQELKRLRAQFANKPGEVSDSSLVLMGLNPLLR